MTTVDELLEQVGRMDPGTRQRLMRTIAERYPDAVDRALFPGVVKTPDVCGGQARMVRTRIPVWLIEEMRRSGMGAVEIVECYPTLEEQDVAQAWAYADAHRDEINAAIRANDEA